jgi:tRNA(Ile)-lysidine synthase
LQTVIRGFGGRESGPERPKLEALAEQLAGPGPVAVTLGGALIKTEPAKRAGSAASPRVLIYREPGRGGIAARALKPGQGIFWDRRFYVSLSPAWKTPVEVRPLGAAGYALLKRRFSALGEFKLPSRAAATLPAIWSGESLMAVPTLSSLEPVLRGPSVAGGDAVAVDFAGQHIRAMLGEPERASVAAR